MSAQGNLVPFIQAADTSEQEMEIFLRSVESPLLPTEDDLTSIDTTVDYYFELIREREAEIARNSEVAARRAAIIEAWKVDANRPHQREIQWLLVTIEGLTRSYDYGKKRTRSLPHGEFGLRRQPESINIVDMPAAVAFAKANDLEIKESVLKTPLHDYLERTGVIPDGVELVAAYDKFFARATR